MKLKKMKLAPRILLSFGAVLVLTLLVGGFSIYGINKLIEGGDDITESNSMMYEIKQKEVDHLNWTSAVQNSLIKGSAEDLNVQVDPHKCAFGQWYYSEKRKAAEKKYSGIKKHLTDIEEPHQRLHQSVVVIKEILQTGKADKLTKATRIFNDETLANLAVLRGHLNEINTDVASNTVLVQEKMASSSSSMRIMVIAVALAAVILGIIMGVMNARSIIKPIRTFMSHFFTGASGDLTSLFPLEQVSCSEIMKCGQKDCPDYGRDGVLCFFDVGSWAPDFGREVHCPKILNGVYSSCRECQVFKTVAGNEIEELAAWYNKFISNIHDMVVQILESSQNLAQAVEQIASGNEYLSQRTTEQSSSLEEIASTVEEANATIKQNAENAIEANRVSDESLSLGEEGNRIAGEAVSSINRISESSNRIGEITALINDIAFQTNLLALNAAVEAARAGEQGRGFAVVAGEVRNLAQRSAAAAKEIEGLIKDSLEKISTGTELSNKSGEALGRIIESIRSYSRLITEIAAASEEQRQGIDQINSAVTELDTMTQQNASLVEENASASEEMANQAQELLGMVRRFKVTENEGIRAKRQELSHREKSEKSGGGNGKNRGTSISSGEQAQREKPIANTKAVEFPKTNRDSMHDILKGEGFEEF